MEGRSKATDLWAHWTRAARSIHGWVGVLFVFLLATGLIFYLPSLRGPTAGFRYLLRAGHIAAGIALLVLMGLALAGPDLRAKLWRRARVKADLALGIGLGVTLLITGIPLWVPGYFPLEWRQPAVFWHGRLALLGFFWLAYHAVILYVIPVARVLADRWHRRAAGARERRPTPVFSRRAFVKQLAWSAAGILLLGLARPWQWGWGRAGTAFGGPGGTGAPVGSSAGFGGLPGSQDLELGPGAAQGGDRSHMFRVYTVTPILPDFDPDTYRLYVDGLVEQPLSLTWQDLLDLPVYEDVSDFHCVSGWGVPQVPWAGFRIEELLKQARPTDDAGFITFHSMDGAYTDSLSLDQSRAPGVLLAYKMFRKFLIKSHGSPLRLIKPQMYGYKGVKWVYRLELTAEPQHAGYWQERGYPIDAWINGQG